MISYETWCQLRDCRDRQHMTLTQIAKALHLLRPKPQATFFKLAFAPA